LFSTMQVAQVYRTATDWIPPDTLGMTLWEQAPSLRSEPGPKDQANSLPRTPEHLAVQFRRLPSANALYWQQRRAASDFLCRGRWGRRSAHRPKPASFARSEYWR